MRMLHRLRDIAQIPAKSAKSPRAVGAWRLAKRMKEAEANAMMKARIKRDGHEVADCDPSESQDWKNVYDYITSAIAKGDFSVMDEFAKAWLAWEIRPDIVAANDDFSLTIHSGETVTNKKLSPVALSVIEAIMTLQRSPDSPDRAPSFQEIQAEVGKVVASGIDETELSRQLRKLGLQNLVPYQDEIGARRKRVETRSGTIERRGRNPENRIIKKTS